MPLQRSKYYVCFWSHSALNDKDTNLVTEGSHIRVPLFANHVHVCMYRINFRFYTYISFLTPLQQTTFENIVAKGESAHDEQFLLFPQYFQLYSMIKHSFVEV